VAQVPKIYYLLAGQTELTFFSEPTLHDAIQVMSKQKKPIAIGKKKNHTRIKSAAAKPLTTAKSKQLPSPEQIPSVVVVVQSPTKSTTLFDTELTRAESKNLALDEDMAPNPAAAAAAAELRNSLPASMTCSSSQPTLHDSNINPIAMNEKMTSEETHPSSKSDPDLTYATPAPQICTRRANSDHRHFRNTTSAGVIVPPLREVTIFNKCYSCRTFTDLVLASLIVGMSADATDLVLEEYQDPISSCTTCKYRVAAGNCDAVRFLRGALEPVVLQPDNQHINIQVRSNCFLVK